MIRFVGFPRNASLSLTMASTMPMTSVCELGLRLAFELRLRNLDETTAVIPSRMSSPLTRR
jgi:hypothetical protein